MFCDMKTFELKVRVDSSGSSENIIFKGGSI